MKGSIVALHLAGVDLVPSGNGVYVECLDGEGRKLGAATLLNPETAIKQYYFDTRIGLTKRVLSLVGLALSASMYLIEVVDRRRRQRRDAAEQLRLNEELAASRAELSEVKARQDPHALFASVAREAELRERRGGPKSPFRS